MGAGLIPTHTHHLQWFWDEIGESLDRRSHPLFADTMTHDDEGGAGYTITVPAGSTIAFVNRDNIDHTVTAGTPPDDAAGTIDLMLPEQGATAQFTLPEPGEYEFSYAIHNHMKGVVEVTP
jgi:plastocyanin